MLMRKAALARDLRGFMSGARCSCGACACGAASGSGARLGRALGMGSGLPDTLLGAPWASLGAVGAGMADCLRRGTLDGAAVGLTLGATPARISDDSRTGRGAVCWSLCVERFCDVHAH